MTRALLLAGLLLVTLSAGCIGGQEAQDQADPAPTDEPGDDPEADGGASQSPASDGGNATGPARQGPPPPFLLQGESCRDARLQVPVDADQARGVIPEGFTLEPYDQPTASPLPGGSAALQVLTLRCSTGGLSGGGDAWTLHLLALEVQPPEALRAAQALEEHYLVEAVADRAAVAQAFTARGWAITEGSANLSLTAPPTGGTVFESQAAGGNLSTQVQGSTVGQNQTQASGFARYWHDPASRLEYLHAAFTSFHDRTNASGLIETDGSAGQAAQLIGPWATGQGALVGPYSLLATPTIVRAG